MSPELTVLVPLKGRHLHTLRFLWHANAMRMPYHFLIADGQVHPTIARLLTNAKTIFPNLDVEYLPYPDDATLTHFYHKMADASARIRTPFVMMADNDDFLVRSGIDTSIEFLKSNCDFASYGGGVGGFTLNVSRGDALAHVVGSIEHLRFRYGNSKHYLPTDYAAESVSQRIRTGFNGSYALYYNVFRSEALAQIQTELVDLDFSDLYVYEQYFGMRAKSLGKSRSDGTVMSYMRQTGTSMFADYRKDWVDQLLRSRFNSDFDLMVSRIAKVVSLADGIDEKVYAEEVRKLYADRLRENLQIMYGGLPPTAKEDKALSLKLFVKLWLRSTMSPWMLEAYRQTFARRKNAKLISDVGGQDLEMIFSELRRFGASENYIAAFREETNNIYKVLGDGEFIEFIRGNASEFLFGSEPQREQSAGKALV